MSPEGCDAYLQSVVVSLLAQKCNELVQLVQLDLSEIDLLLLADLEDILDDVVRELQQLLAQLWVRAPVEC